MVRQFYTRDDQRLPQILKQQQRSIADIQRPTGTERGLAIANLTLAVAELQARQSITVFPANLAVSGNATVAPFPSATRDLDFAAPVGGRRTAVLTLGGLLTNSGGVSNSVQAFVEILHNGTRVWGTDSSVPKPTSAPSGWAEQVAAAVTVRVPAGAPPQLQVRIHRVGFTSTVTTLTLSQITATLTYGATY